MRRLVEAGLLAETSDPHRGNLCARIRSSRLVPYQAVIGPREAKNGTVSLRVRTGSHCDPLPTPEAVARVAAAVTRLGLEL